MQCRIAIPAGGRSRAAFVAAIALVALFASLGSAVAGPPPPEIDSPDLGTMPAGLASSEDLAPGFQAQADQTAIIPILFPFEQRISWEDTWGASRSGGTRSHRGNDLPAPKGTPLVAVVDGELDWMNMDAEPSSYNGVPSFNILLRGDDGNVYFYIHLNNDTPGTDDGKGGVKYAYAPGLTNGSRVSQGQLIGYVGDSGNAEGTISHLHFELHVGGYGDANAINPYESLMAAPTLEELGRSLRVFRDVAEQEWYYEDLMWLYELGVAKGSGDGNFYPYQNVSRAQFAALLVRALVDDELASVVQTAAVFSDVGEGHWARDEVRLASGLGVVRGRTDGTFAPEESITRAQMAAMICRMVQAVQTGSPVTVEEPTAPDEPATGDPGTGDPDTGDPEPGGTEAPIEPASAGGQEPEPGPFVDVSAEHWAAGDIEEAGSMRLLSGRTDGTFGPEDPTKRVHASVVVARALRLLGAAAPGS